MRGGRWERDLGSVWRASGLSRQQVLDKLEVSGRVFTFPHRGGSSIYQVLRN